MRIGRFAGTTLLLTISACTAIVGLPDVPNPADGGNVDATLLDSAADGGLTDGSPGADGAGMDGTVHDGSVTDAGSLCGNPGDKGNSLGVGQYCTGSVDAACTGAATICSAPLEPNTNFCTMTCSADAGADACGEMAVCVHGSVDFCEPTACPALVDSGVDSGPGGEAGVTCSTPAQCGGSPSVCCDTIPITGGLPPCEMDGGHTACATGAACPTTLGFNCSGSYVVRLCATNADCTEATYDHCCSVPLDGDSGTLSICANSTIMSLFGGSCM